MRMRLKVFIYFAVPRINIYISTCFTDEAAHSFQYIWVMGFEKDFS